MVGQIVGKYQVIERIGRGGMGTVYRAMDEMLHRDVAIKVLNAELNDPEVARRFRAEAITVARLNHPGIATIYELFEHDGQWLMVMEFVRGETLEHLVERMGPLSPQRAAELCMQALTALAHAHSLGVIHRDLKPANMMITDTGTVKIMDFGIARVTGTEHLTNAGFMMGTPAYMAPEQVLGHEIDARADLYSMGVVFYRLTSAKLPFKGDTPFAMAQSQVNDTPVPLGMQRTDLPPWADQVATRALSKAREERFQSAVEFYEAFSRCLAGLPITTLYNPSAPTELLMTPARAMPTGTLTSGMSRSGSVPSPQTFSTTMGHTPIAVPAPPAPPAAAPAPPVTTPDSFSAPTVLHTPVGTAAVGPMTPSGTAGLPQAGATGNTGLPQGPVTPGPTSGLATHGTGAQAAGGTAPQVVVGTGSIPAAPVQTGAVPVGAATGALATGVVATGTGGTGAVAAPGPSTGTQPVQAPVGGATGAVAAAPTATLPTPAPKRGANTAILVVLAAAVVVLASVLVVFFLQSRQAAAAEQAAATSAPAPAPAVEAPPPVTAPVVTAPPVATPPPVAAAPAASPASSTLGSTPPATTARNGAPATPTSTSPPASTPAGRSDTAGTTPASRTGTGSGSGTGTPSTDGRTTPAVADEHVTFSNVKVMNVTGKKAQDQDVMLNFVAGQISVTSKNGGTALESLPYKTIAHATYIHAKDPKYDTSLPSPPDGLDLPGGLFGRGTKHWLVLQTKSSYVMLRLDDGNFSQILDTIEARLGIKVNRQVAPK